MVVYTRAKVDGVTSLQIGGGNVKEYFSPDVRMIELELDQVRILCPVEPTLSEDRPEIHDRRLSCWLQAKCSTGKLAMRTSPIALIPSGENVFRLEPMSAELVADAHFPIGYAA